MEAVHDRWGARPGVEAAYRDRSLHIAIISTADGVVATYADWTAEGLLVRLSQYVEESAGWKLWPDAARRVLALVRRGRNEAAVALYFERTGERWDAERLHREVLEFE